MQDATPQGGLPKKQPGVHVFNQVEQTLPRDWYTGLNIQYSIHIYNRARKLFGHLNARRCDFNINIIIPTRKPPLSVRN